MTPPNYRPIFQQLRGRENARRAIQAQIDARYAEAGNLTAQAKAHWESSVDGLNTALAALPDGATVPAVLAASDSQLLLGVADDKIVAFEADEQGRITEHLYGPPDGDDMRQCETAGHAHQIRYGVVRVGKA